MDIMEIVGSCSTGNIIFKHIIITIELNLANIYLFIDIEYFPLKRKSVAFRTIAFT